jgi:uncharacterized protein YggU (UPF0235/DUF167 family)
LSDALFYRLDETGAVLDIRLTPKGGRDGIDAVAALADGRQVLLARVRAAPEKGAANAALELLIAKRLDWPRSAVSILSGHTSRLKRARVDGDPQEIAKRLASFTQP